MNQALGTVETKSLVGAVAAADAMVKAADVHILKVDYVGSGIVAVIVEGEVAAVKAAVECGKEAAVPIAEIIASHVIPRPNDELEKLLSLEG